VHSKKIEYLQKNYDNTSTINSKWSQLSRERERERERANKH